jgi:hypothetical protein
MRHAETFSRLAAPLKRLGPVVPGGDECPGSPRYVRSGRLRQKAAISLSSQTGRPTKLRAREFAVAHPLPDRREGGTDAVADFRFRQQPNFRLKIILFVVHGRVSPFFTMEN